MRAVARIGTPRTLQGRGASLAGPGFSFMPALARAVRGLLGAFGGVLDRIWPESPETGMLHA